MGEKGGASSAKRRFGILSPFQTTITIRLSISICQKVIHTGSVQTVAGQIACAVSNIILWSSVIGYAGYHTRRRLVARSPIIIQNPKRTLPIQHHQRTNTIVCFDSQQTHKNTGAIYFLETISDNQSSPS